MEFVNELELWLKTERKRVHNTHNTTMKYISILKMLVLFCVNNNWLDKDPFARFKISKLEVIPVFFDERGVGGSIIERNYVRTTKADPG